jgi:glycine oxidase
LAHIQSPYGARHTNAAPPQKGGIGKPRSQIIVVGAGPVGLYTAWVLARSGYSVRVIDDGRRGAGWASGGMLGAAYEVLGSQDVPHAFKAFARASQQLWSRYLAQMQAPIVEGSIFIARTHVEAKYLDGLKSRARAFDVSFGQIDMPLGLVGVSALSCPTDIAFDPRHMLKMLRYQCHNQGVSFVDGSVTQVTSGKVTLRDGSSWTGDHIVIATGHAGNELAQSVPELSSLSLVKGQMLAIGGSGVALDRVVRAGRMYLIPRGDRIIVGATSDPDDVNPDVLDLARHAELLNEAIALCPALARGHVVESWAGMRPTTPDGLPLVGPSSVDGVMLACGTYRNGWLLAAGIANSVMGLIGDGLQSAADLLLFAPNRFSMSAQRTNCPDKDT